MSVYKLKLHFQSRIFYALKSMVYLCGSWNLFSLNKRCYKPKPLTLTLISYFTFNVVRFNPNPNPYMRHQTLPWICIAWSHWNCFHGNPFVYKISSFFIYICFCKEIITSESESFSFWFRVRINFLLFDCCIVKIYNAVAVETKSWRLPIKFIRIVVMWISILRRFINSNRKITAELRDMLEMKL